VVAEHRDRAETSSRKVPVDRRQLIERTGMVAHEIAGHDDDVRAQRRHALKRRQQVVVVYAGADVEVAQLDQRASSQV
jgi:hypothetical protein